ncbi:putative ankyrin [Podospora fimiseda]|uniref:Ankyrin n=1 Tax=Podospora fimiseda TaxID=252190 RepID=A0AAN6YM70_9PEZI|nr:putative ankyrin [Podospora fimiseda]
MPELMSNKFLEEYLAQKKSEYRTLYKRWRTTFNPYDWPPWHGTDQCYLVSLPHELLVMICDYLYLADLLHLALTCRMFADFTIPTLYTLDVTRFDCLSLRWGCTFGIIETLERSFSYGASANHKFSLAMAMNCNWVDQDYTLSSLCNTPLMIAIRWNELGVIRFLLRKGAKVHETVVLPGHARAYYPLHFAIGIPDVNLGPSFEPGCPQVVRCLVEAEADPNLLAGASILSQPLEGPNGDTPLSLAMKRPVSLETVKVLLQAGAKPFHYAKTDRSALMSTTSIRWYIPSAYRSFRDRRSFFQLDEDKIDLLLSNTEPSRLVPIFCRWLEALHTVYYSYSLCQRSARLALLFMKNGVDLVSCADSGISPIVSVVHAVRVWRDSLWARRSVKLGKFTVVMELLHQIITEMCEATIVGNRGESCKVKRSRIIDAINSNPETSNGHNASRDTSALQLACMPFGFPGQATLISLLLQYGANPFRTDSDGAGVLHLAAMFGPEDRMRLVLEFRDGLWPSRLDVNVRDNYGWTPLHYACVFGIRTKLQDQVRTARLLLDHGADVDARTDDGWTCLEFAFRCGNGDMVRLLSERGALAEQQIRPPGWEDTEDSSPIWFCECVERSPPFMLTRLVAYYRRASSAVYTGSPSDDELREARRLLMHWGSCCDDDERVRVRVPLFPFGIFRGAISDNVRPASR